MKLSTAIRKAARLSSVQFFGGQYIVVRYHRDDNQGFVNRYTTSSNSMSYREAVQYRKEYTAKQALIILGVDEEQAVAVSFVYPHGTAQEIAQRVIDEYIN